MRPVIFSSAGRRNGWASCSARERSIEVWNVATTGPSYVRSASSDTLGVIGSWTCRTSKSPRSTQRAVRLAATGPNARRATEPL